MSTRSYAWTLYVDTFECFLTEQQVKGGKEQGREQTHEHMVHCILCALTQHDFYCSLCRKGSQKSTAGELSGGGGGAEGVTGGKEVPPESARRRSSSDDRCVCVNVSPSPLLSLSSFPCRRPHLREGPNITDSKLAKPSGSIDKRRSTSLTSLPQAKASPRLQQQKPAHKHNSTKKVEWRKTGYYCCLCDSHSHVLL